MHNDNNSNHDIKSLIEEDFKVVVRMFKLLYTESKSNGIGFNFNTLTKIDNALLTQLQTVLNTPTNDINILYEILDETIKECQNNLINIEKQIRIKLNNHIKNHLKVITTTDINSEFKLIFKDDLYTEKEKFTIPLKQLIMLKTALDEFLVNNVLTTDKMIKQINSALNSIFKHVESTVMNDIFIDYVNYTFGKLKSLATSFKTLDDIKTDEVDTFSMINAIKQLILAFISIKDYYIITSFIFTLIDSYEMIKISIMKNKINYTKYKINFIKAPEILLNDDELELHTEIIKACKYNLNSFTIQASNGTTLPIVVTNLIEKFNIIDALYRYKTKHLKQL